MASIVSGGDDRPPVEPQRPPLTSASHLARNVLYSGASQVWSLAMLIVTTPILVHSLGEDAFGVFVFASVLLGYAAFLDLGLTPAVVRFIAIHHATSEDRDLERIIGTAFAVLLGLALVGGLMLVLLTPFAVGSFLHLPAHLHGDAAFVLYLAAIGFGCNMCLTLFGAVPQGLQRLDLFAIRSIFLSTATAVAQITAILLGGGLRWVAVVTIAVNIASLGVFVVVARQLLPHVRFFPRIDRWALRELAGFGLMRFLNNAAGQIVFQLDRLIVAAFLPIGALTLYSVPLSVAQKFVIVQAIFSSAFFPAAAELHGVQDRGRLKRLYISTMKLALVMVFPLVILVGGFARPILNTWLDPHFGEASAGVLLVLAIAYGIAQLMGVPALASDATGHVRWTTAFAIASALVNLSLTLLLVPRLGVIGAAYALLINAATQGLIFVYVVQRWFLGIQLPLVLKRVVVRTVLPALVLGVYTLLLSPHVHSFVQLLTVLLAGGLLYMTLTIVLGVWDRRELAVARGVVRSILPRFERES